MTREPIFRPDLDAEVNEEFRFHLDAEVEELMAGGLSPEAARAGALRRFGDVSYFTNRCRRSDQRRSARERGRELLDGTLGSLAAGKVLSGLLYGVTATDPLVFGGVVVLLGAVALVAAGIPALRASRIDPVTTMGE